MCPRADSPRDDPPRLRLTDGQSIQLSLFNPALPGLFIDHVIAGGSQACRCAVRVQEQGPDGLVVSMPPCKHAGDCFTPGRRLYATCDTDFGRMGFDAAVADGPGAEGLPPGTLRLGTPERVRAANHRAHYRVELFPAHRYYVPVEFAPDPPRWRAIIDAYLAAGDTPTDNAAHVEAARATPAVVTDVSLGGVGLATSDSPDVSRTGPRSVVLVHLDLPELPGPIPCRVEVRWKRRFGCGATRLGGRFLFAGDRALRDRVERDLGAWLLDRQRRQLNRPCV